uniref:Uncharacterized protein n=1 Tax=Heterorhabditis bacteriophora TaxID=37862 RepID=A0A1I7X773_HETBA
MIKYILVFNQIPSYSGIPSSPGSTSGAARGQQPFDATAALYANLGAQPFGDGGLYVSPQPLHNYHNKHNTSEWRLHYICPDFGFEQYYGNSLTPFGCGCTPAVRPGGIALRSTAVFRCLRPERVAQPPAAL